MTNSKRLATVRACLLSWISRSAPRPAIGAPVTENVVEESILIRNEFYVGRRFRTESYQGVWFIEEDELKIYDRDNRVCAVLSAADIDATVPMLTEPMPADPMPADAMSVDLESTADAPVEAVPTDQPPAVFKLVKPNDADGTDEGEGEFRRAA